MTTKQETLMNKEILSFQDLSSEISKINGLINNLDNIIDEFSKKIDNLSIENNIYYSTASIKINDTFQENKVKIKQLHNSLRDFINQTPKIIDTYEDLEMSIIQEVDKIPSINIELQ